MEDPPRSKSSYHRYHIKTETVPNIVPWPNRFRVNVNRFQLAKYMLGEVFHQRGDIKAITSRPCMYGTFSGPIGGFAPRPQHCVGCLRCTIQHPEIITILHNPDFQALGDSYFHFGHIGAIAYEAETGSIPVKGAGYRGKFGGEGWDGMWTDMSEIVRPTRDGIHGREFISTVVEIGEKPSYLVFDEEGQPVGAAPRILAIPIPFIYDTPPLSVTPGLLADILSDSASQAETLSILPIEQIANFKLNRANLVPLIKANQVEQVSRLSFTPKMIEIELGDALISDLQSLLSGLQSSFPDTILALRLPYKDDETLLSYAEVGIRVFHFIADYHGRGEDGRFVFDLIREAHLAFVEAKMRDEVTLIGSGGIVAAEHVPKAIIAGLDLVALDTPLLVAMQATLKGECQDRNKSQFMLPRNLNREWGIQRILNMTAAWRDQLLEILGAMGLREVRRLRGEMGRAMFQVDLEREAFAGIEGYK
jgi:Conserved region in glutamate synthase